MTITIRHADGRQLEVAEETFTGVFEAQGFERVSESERLNALTREELNQHAADLGVADPASFPNKAALIDAIETARTAADQAVETEPDETDSEETDAEPAEEELA